MLKSAIIGLGNAGFMYDHEISNEILTHTRAYNESKYTSLECVADIDENKTNIFKKKYNIPVYKDYNEMLKKHHVDIVSIATNNENHVDVLLDILKFDIKIIFCEKPISNNLDKLDNLKKTYLKRKIPIYVNYFRKWDNQFKKIGKLINNSNKGDLLKIEIHYSKGLVHTGTHYLDFLIDWFGKPIRWTSPTPIEKINSSDFTSSFDIFFMYKDKEVLVRMIGMEMKNDTDKVSVFFKKSKIEIIGARFVNYYKYNDNNKEEIVKKEPTEFNNIILKIINNITKVPENSDAIHKDNFKQSYKILEYAIEINKSLF